MKNILFPVFAVGCYILIVGFSCGEVAYSQMRVPTPNVAALATQSGDNTTVEENETVTWSAPASLPVTPIQYALPPQEQQQVPSSQQVAPQQVMPQMQLAAPQAVPQPVMAPGMMGGAIVIPVVVPQYMTYNPPPVTMMVNQPAQLVIPQYQAPMMQPIYNPIAMPMMQQQTMQQQMMPQQMMPMSPVMPMMQPQAPPQQPIPIKMIMPDGSTVSIKHYMPGQFFKNVVRAVTP